MPIIQSNYRIPRFYNKHLSTIWMGRLRSAAKPAYIRERIIYQTNDFLDLDWLFADSTNLAILSHGLEGSSNSHAVRQLACNLNQCGFNILAWNMCGCSEEPNKRLQSYCSGSSEQLAYVVEHILRRDKFSKIFLLGISVGGNITLKYLAENAGRLNSRIISAMAVCPPCDLAGSSKAFEKFSNKIYLLDFLKSLKNKVRQKKYLLTDDLDYKKILKSKTFAEFDRFFTAPVNGYKDEKDYYFSCSSLPVLEKICLPSLILTAIDDPFLSQSCFPFKSAKKNDYLNLEAPDYGGHVAFPWKNWLSDRAKEWLMQTS